MEDIITSELVIPAKKYLHHPNDNKYIVRDLVPVEAYVEAKVACIIPAYNEEGSISATLESLLNQTLLPDEIHVVVNNSKDNTFYEAKEYAGEHIKSYRERIMTTEVYVHDIGTHKDKKVGALNYGFELVRNRDFDYFLGVDGDTLLERDALEHLVEEMAEDSRIGGLSSIYSIDSTHKTGFFRNFLLTGQKQQFADFTMKNLLRGRNMSVLGGQCSLFSMEALEAVMLHHRQDTPWVTDSDVEDSLLSLQIKSVGYLTRVSAEARALVGGMETLKSLDAQQVKWNRGAIGLMYPGQRGTLQGQPFHPNLRMRWWEHLDMLGNIVTRVMLILLVAASVSMGTFMFHPFWLLPPLLAVVVNTKMALSMKDRKARDVLFGLTLIPSEIYMWIRMGHFVRSWISFFSSRQFDSWAAQSQAERGGGGNAYLRPILYLAIVLTALGVTWYTSPEHIKEAALWVSWSGLVVLSVIQSLVMLRRVLRSHQGYQV